MDKALILKGLFVIIYGFIIKINARKISEQSHKFDFYLFGFKHSPDSINKGERLGKAAGYLIVLCGLLLMIFNVAKG